MSQEPIGQESIGQEPIFELRDITRRFSRTPDLATRIVRRLTGRRAEPVTHAVDGVSLAIKKGEVVGLVGESGCGKSTLGRIAAGIMEPSSGTVTWQGRDLASMDSLERRKAKLEMQIIFQDPMASLNPRLRVSDLVGEAPFVHGLVKRSELGRYVDEQLRRAGLDPSFKRRYPHQFSGGQRQRISIARALSVNPKFLVCDESVAALDVSIQAQILNLFMELRQQLDLTYLFISHDLGVVQHLSDRVAIMYLGRLVEEAPTETVFARPNHPYTRSLLAAIPRIDAGRQTFSAVTGEIPSPLAPPPGCHFHPRCPLAFGRCSVERPAFREIAPGHRSACHLNDMAGDGASQPEPAAQLAG